MRAPKRGRYHHGDLPAALIATAIEVIDERGVHGFSLAEASRRLGVAPSAPYAHFADRDDLLAAVAAHALELFQRKLQQALRQAATPQERLAVFVRTYVLFAATHKTLFQGLVQMDLDKNRYPDLEAAERAIDESFRSSVRAVSPGRPPTAEETLAAAIEAVAHGHATLLLDGRFGRGKRAVESAAESAARSALAVAEGWKP